jgi:hypothetical protein
MLSVQRSSDMAQYDPKVIHRFADDLYSRAGTIVVIYTIIFAVVGIAAGAVAYAKMGAMLGGLFAAAVGFYIGQQRTFVLKLQAQTALCQAQIEANTRTQGRGEADSVAQTAGETLNQGLARPSIPSVVKVQPQELGTCTSCSAVIPVSSATCPNCTAAFGGSSKWRVQAVTRTEQR